MSRIEDLLRAATRDAGADIKAGSLPALDLSGVRWGRRLESFWMRFGGRLSGGRGVLLPALAAALVVVVVALSLTLPGLLRAGQPGRPSRPAGAGTPGVPRYYVTGSGPQEAHGVLRPVNALVVDSSTGAVAATVKPPPGFASFALFGGGAADDETFVVAAQKDWHPVTDVQTETANQAPYLDNFKQPLTFFVLTFNPATGGVTLRQLPPVTVLEPLSSVQISLPGRPAKPARTHEVHVTAGEAGDLAVSPDGTRLAIMLFSATPDGLSNALYVRVIPLDSAAAPKNWEVPGLGSKRLPISSKMSVSWGPGDQVMFATIDGVALLDTGKPGGSLLAQARIVLLGTRPPDGTTLGNYFWCPVPPTLTGDGTRLVCAGTLRASTTDGAGGRTVASAIGTYSALTGQLESLSGMQPYNAHTSLAIGEIAWASRDGGALVAYRRNPYDVNYMPLNGPTSVVEIRDGHIARTIQLPHWEATSTLFTGLGNSIAW